MKYCGCLKPMDKRGGICSRCGFPIEDGTLTLNTAEVQGHLLEIRGHLCNLGVSEEQLQWLDRAKVLLEEGMDLDRELRDVLRRVRLVWDVVSAKRIASVDQNEKGWRDLLGGLVSKADKMDPR